jgi:predicted ester cyclase
MDSKPVIGPLCKRELPGIAPTGKRVEVALVVIVHFRDGKLAHEHIYWDQASVLLRLSRARSQ